LQAFRAQVQPIDMIGCTDVARIHAWAVELAQVAAARPIVRPARAPAGSAPVERVVAAGVDPARIKLDEAGYFVIHVEGEALLVEHYSYREELLRVIEGRTARELYLTLIGNGWVSRLDHAAYLGKELARAEWSVRQGLPFVQDGA